jgi:hypothetical protein
MLYFLLLLNVKNFSNYFFYLLNLFSDFKEVEFNADQTVSEGNLLNNCIFYIVEGVLEVNSKEKFFFVSEDHILGKFTEEKRNEFTDFLVTCKTESILLKFDKESFEKFTNQFPIMCDLVMQKFYSIFSLKEKDKQAKKSDFILSKLKEITNFLDKRENILENKDYEEIIEKMLNVLTKVQKNKKKK